MKNFDDIRSRNSLCNYCAILPYHKYEASGKFPEIKNDIECECIWVANVSSDIFEN